MNFIQTGDIHIRVRPEIPEDWQLNRYRLLFMTILDLCRKHKARLFLSGDILDRNRPSLVEMKLFIELITVLAGAGIDTWLISGNHEAIGQGESTFDYFEAFFATLNESKPQKDCLPVYFGTSTGRIHYNPNNISIASFPEAKLNVLFVGHPALQQGLALAGEYAKSPSGDGTARILITHVRPNVNHFIREEIDVEKLIEPFDYCFASDIHEPLEMYDDKLVYTNSPLNCSFEAKPNCGCLLISVADGEVVWERIPLKLPNLIQIATTAAEYREPPKDGSFFRVEITGSSADLREITSGQDNLKLLKIPELAETYVESDDAEEIKESTLDQALIEYMQSLDFSDQKIQSMMEVYREP